MGDYISIQHGNTLIPGFVSGQRIKFLSLKLIT